MVNEYFSAVGSGYTPNVTGVIDDPNYTLYVNTTGDDYSGHGTLAKPFKSPQKALWFLRDKFITQNGFAHIQVGSGRYSLTDSIEIRHPQGDRIGIKGQKTNTFNLRNCHGYTSSHASLDNADPVDLRGSMRPRYYTSAIKVVGVVNPDGQYVGTISGVSGDYLLLKDHSMQHLDDYDNVNWDWNLNGKTAKRASLLGCNILDGENTDTTNIKMTMKYYNFPYQKKMDFQDGRGTFQNDGDLEAIVKVGGCRDTARGGRDLMDEHWKVAADAERYFTYSSDPLENTHETKENAAEDGLPGGDGHPAVHSQVYFGNTAEGQEYTPSNHIASHYTCQGDELGEYHSRKKCWTQPKHSTSFVSFNRITATHVNTVFSFTDKTKPGFLLDGSQLGYIHNIIIEGQWKQFKQGFNQGAGGTSENHSIMDNHAGIFVRNGGNLSYDLGKTGGDIAELKFYEVSNINADAPPISSDSITISNVGINGFVAGAIVENDSRANLDDILISNCELGIVANNNSQISCARSTLIGFEDSGIVAWNSSRISAPKSMIAHIGCPKYEIEFNIESADWYQRRSRDSSFLSGYEVIFDKTDNPTYAGIVDSWGSRPRVGPTQQMRLGRDNSSTHNKRTLVLYDHKGMTTYNDEGNIATPTTAIVYNNGLTGASGGDGETQPGANYEDAATSGHLKPFLVSQKNNGDGIIAARNSSIDISLSSIFYAYRHGVVSRDASSINGHSAVISCNAGYGAFCLFGSKIDIPYSRMFHCLQGGVRALNATININNSCLEQCGGDEGIIISQSSSVYYRDSDLREGVTLTCGGLLNAQYNSYIDRHGYAFQAYHKEVPDSESASATTPLPTNKYNTIVDSNDVDLYPPEFISRVDTSSVIYE
jgi:hypothetical protein